jgi:hypothetical protein
MTQAQSDYVQELMQTPRRQAERLKIMLERMGAP